MEERALEGQSWLTWGTQEAEGWTGPAEVKETRETKEGILVRALGSKTYPHKPQVFPGAHVRQPEGLTLRRTAGLSEPRTACLSGELPADSTSDWFWLGPGHSPDT